MKQRLPSYEWLVVIVFVISVALFSIVALVRTYHAAEHEKNLPIHGKKKEIVIKVEGEVAEPGFYNLPLKSTLKQLLAKVRPLSSADISEFKERQKLRDGQTIRFPSRHMITITLEGAVKSPGVKEILSGYRVHELLNEIDFLPDADVKRLEKRNRFIKDGDTLYVPKKGESVKRVKINGKKII